MKFQSQLGVIQRNQEALRATMQAQFRVVRQNQVRHGGTIYSALSRRNNLQLQRLDCGVLEQQQAARRIHDRLVQTQHLHNAPPPARREPQGQREPQFSSLRGIDSNARLYPRPKTLQHLWDEFMNGLDGNKAARLFTSAERNNRVQGIKQKYHRRNKVWKIQQLYVNAGITIAQCNAKLMEFYAMPVPTDSRVEFIHAFVLVLWLTTTSHQSTLSCRRLHSLLLLRLPLLLLLLLPLIQPLSNVVASIYIYNCVLFGFSVSFSIVYLGWFHFDLCLLAIFGT